MSNYTRSCAETSTARDLTDPWLVEIPSSLIMDITELATYDLAYKRTWNFTTPKLPVSMPQRITGVMVHWFGTIDSGDDVRPFFRCGSEEWYSDTAFATMTNYHQYLWFATNPFTNRRWSSSDLTVDFEAGYYDVNENGGSTINTFELCVATEAVPTAITPFNGDGYHWQWDRYPQLGTAATGWIDFVLSGLADNDHFTLFNGWDTSTFEFRVTLGFLATPGWHIVDVLSLTTDAEVAQAVKDEIVNGMSWASHMVNIDATVSANRVSLTNRHPGVHGNSAIPYVSAGGGIVACINGMSGGTATVSPRHETVAKDDGDRSYLTAIDYTAWKVSWRHHGSAPYIPNNHDINKITLFARAKGSGEIVPFVRECGMDFHDTDLITQLTDEWKDYRWTWHYRPTFAAFGEPVWFKMWVQNADWGFLNVSGGDNKITSARLEWFSAVQPAEVKHFFPNTIGVYDDWDIGSPDTGEAKYEDVNTYLANDTSYITADLTASTAIIQTFGLGYQSTGDLAPKFITKDYNVWNVRWISRLRANASAKVAPVWYSLTSGKQHVGRAFAVGGVGGDWKSYAEDYWVNPITGDPWTVSDLQDVDVGIAVVESGGTGTLYCSRLCIRAGLVPDSFSDMLESTFTATFTDTALSNIDRCVGDNLVWKVDKFSVGRGGFQELHPGSVLPLVSSNDTLADEVWRGPIYKTQWQNWTAYYWCAVPPNTLSDPLGEIMLWARIVSSDNTKDVVGSYFPMAVAHFPAAWHTIKDVRVLLITLAYNENLIQRWHTDGVTAIDAKTVV